MSQSRKYTRRRRGSRSSFTGDLKKDLTRYALRRVTQVVVDAGIDSVRNQIRKTLDEEDSRLRGFSGPKTHSQMQRNKHMAFQSTQNTRTNGRGRNRGRNTNQDDNVEYSGVYVNIVMNDPEGEAIRIGTGQRIEFFNPNTDLGNTSDEDFNSDVRVSNQIIERIHEIAAGLEAGESHVLTPNDTFSVEVRRAKDRTPDPAADSERANAAKERIKKLWGDF